MASFNISGYTPPTGVSNAEQVKQIQQQLVKAGYDIGKTGADGIWGKNTQAAYDAYLANGTNRTSGGAVTMKPVTVTPDWSVPADMLDSIGSSGGTVGGSYGGGTAGGSMSAYYGLPSVPSSNIGAAYDKAAVQYKNALDAAYNAQKADIDAQAAKLADQYNAIRSQAYTNARLNAIGNNEVMASLGLAGNLYKSPVSGVSETSRVNQDIGMRNDINAATRQEQGERDTLALELLQAGYTRDVEYAKWMADMMIAKAQAEQAAAQQAFENQMALAKMYADMYGSSGSSSSSGSRRSSSSSKKTSAPDTDYATAAGYLEKIARQGATKKEMQAELDKMGLPQYQKNALSYYTGVLASDLTKPYLQKQVGNQTKQ